MTERISDEQLNAYLHGELSDEAASAVEAAMAADPQLEARAAFLAEQDDEIRGAFAAILDDDIPDRLRSVVADAPKTANVIDLSAERARRKNRSWGVPQFSAMAASLAIGLFAGQSLTGGDSAAGTTALVLASADGARVTDAVGKQLSTLPGGKPSALSGLGELSVAITFKTTDDRICRQFAVRAGEQVTDAVACRAGKAWTLEALGRRPEQAGDMRTAAGDAAPAVTGAVDALIAGDPLVGEAELTAVR